jgi:hypothetical protein
MTSLKVVNNVANPNYFISIVVKKKKIIGIIPALWMDQAAHFLKSMVEITFYVSHFNLAPCMAIMFLVHSLHLPLEWLSRLTRGGEFKQNITI